MNYKRNYSQMTLSDRLAIEVGIERKESFKEIAKRLNRHPSTIAHEVKENRTFIQGAYPGGNDCKHARNCAKKSLCGEDEFCRYPCRICRLHNCHDLCENYISVEIYKHLLSGDSFGTDKHFSKAYISLNSRSGLENMDYKINDDGIPCCPHDETLPMKPEGITYKKSIKTFKFVCPKIKWVYDKTTKKSHRECLCDNKCTDSKSGRMVYIYPEKALRTYPGTIRGTKEWDDIYKVRTAVERDINHFKDSFCLADRRTQNEKTLHADLILAGITQLITVVLAEKIHNHEYIRRLKPLLTA